MARNKTYKETKLPKRLDKALANVNWAEPDVLVGALRNRYQLDISLECNFYHMPATKIDPSKVRYVAIYQSLTLFGRGGGVRWYGKVSEFEKVRRYEIDEIPKDSDEWYYRFDVSKWRRLTKPIPAGGVAFVHLLTNHFLLRNCRSIPELLIGSEHQFRWIYGLKKAMSRVKRFMGRESGFWFDGTLTVVTRNCIICIRDGRVVGQLENAPHPEKSCEELFGLYGQVYPEYAFVERQMEYAE